MGFITKVKETYKKIPKKVKKIARNMAIAGALTAGAVKYVEPAILYEMSPPRQNTSVVMKDFKEDVVISRHELEQRVGYKVNGKLDGTIAQHLIGWTDEVRKDNPSSLKNLVSVTVIPKEYQTYTAGSALWNSFSIMENADQDTFNHELAHINTTKKVKDDFYKVGEKFYRHPHISVLAAVETRIRKGKFASLTPKQGFIGDYDRSNVYEHIADFVEECGKNLPNKFAEVDPKEEDIYLGLLKSLYDEKMISKRSYEDNVRYLGMKHPKKIERRALELASSLTPPSPITFEEYGQTVYSKDGISISKTQFMTDKMLTISVTPFGIEEGQYNLTWKDGKLHSMGKNTAPKELIDSLRKQGYEELSHIFYDPYMIPAGETLESKLKQWNIPQKVAQELKGPIHYKDPISREESNVYYRIIDTRK